MGKGSQKRFTVDEKEEVVRAYLSGEVKMAELCRAHQVSSTTVYNWRDKFLKGGRKGLKGEQSSDREDELEEENRRRRELVGDLALAKHLLKGGAASKGNNGGRGQGGRW